MAFIPTTFYSGVVGTASGDTALYTVPAGKTAIVYNWIFSPSNGDASAYLYLGGSSVGILCYNRLPGPYNYSGMYIGNTSTNFKGFYVVHAGESILAGGDQRNGWQTVQGVLCNDTDTVGGLKPKRLGTRAPNGDGSGSSVNIYSAGAGGAVINTLLVSNYSGSQANYGVRLAACPIVPWYGEIQDFEVKQFDMNLKMYSGENIGVDDFTPGAQGRLRFTAYGWAP